MKYSKFIYPASIVLVTLLLNVFFGRFLAAKISTIGFFGKFKLLSPQAPVVFNTKEEVRFNETESLQSAISKSKNKLVQVVYSGKDGWVDAGEGVVVSEDGLLLSVMQAFPETGVTYFAKFASGELLPITKLTNTSSSDLVVFNVEKTGLSPVDFAKPENLMVGQNIFSLELGSLAYQVRMSEGVVSRVLSDIPLGVMSADNLDKFLGVDGLENLTKGCPIFDYNGNLVGIWNGSRVIASVNTELVVSNYLQNNKNLVFPTFGFNYRYMLSFENSEIKKGLGVKVVVPDKGFSGLAREAGIFDGDVIVKINDLPFSADNLLENNLLDLKSGESLKLSVLRFGKPVDLVLGKK